MHRLILVIFLVLQAPGAHAAVRGWASEALDRGLGGYKSGNYSAARHSFKRLAGHGSAIAETMLGIMYAEGKGVAANPTVSAAYFYRAASRGYGPAAVALSDAFSRGRGVASSVEDAYFWAIVATYGGDRSAERQGRERMIRLARQIDPASRAGIVHRFKAWRPRAAR